MGRSTLLAKKHGFHTLVSSKLYMTYGREKWERERERGERNGEGREEREEREREGGR